MISIPMKLMISGILIFFLLSSTTTIIEGYDREIIETKCRGLVRTIIDRFDGITDNVQMPVNIKLPKGIHHRVVMIRVPADVTEHTKIGFYLDDGSVIWVVPKIGIVDMRPNGDGRIYGGVHMISNYYNGRDFLAIVA